MVIDKVCAGTRGFADVNCLVVSAWAIKREHENGSAGLAIAKYVRGLGVQMGLADVSAPTVGHEGRQRYIMMDGKRKLCRYLWASIELGPEARERVVKGAPHNGVQLRSAYTPSGHGLTREWPSYLVDKIKSA
jgi:hypothetical protein